MTRFNTPISGRKWKARTDEKEMLPGAYADAAGVGDAAMITAAGGCDGGGDGGGRHRVSEGMVMAAVTVVDDETSRSN